MTSAGALVLAQEVDPNVIITALSTIIVAYAGIWGGRKAIASAKKRHAAGDLAEDEPTVPPSPLAAFAGTQNEFMALVVQDSVNLRAELAQVARDSRAELEQHRAASSAELAGLRAELALVRADLEAATASHAAFFRAVRRYLEQLFHAWPNTLSIPDPDPHDVPILAAALPRVRGRRA